MFEKFARDGWDGEYISEEKEDAYEEAKSEYLEWLSSADIYARSRNAIDASIGDSLAEEQSSELEKWKLLTSTLAAGKLEM